VKTRSRFYRPPTSNEGFTDLLFNALLGFAFMFFIAFMLIATPQQSGKVNTKAEFLITVSWPDFHPDDVDVLVEDPQGQVLWFDNRDTGVMHLDRDDRGSFQDQVIIDGKKISNPINQETVSLRAWIPGEYVVNLLHYKANYTEALPVTVKIEKLNPQVSLVYYGVHQLDHSGMELTATRFVLDGEGNSVDVSPLQKPLLHEIGNKTI
jgi:hypothetical protein